VSDFLAEMEARKTRAPKSEAPIAAIVGGFALVLFTPLLLTFLTLKPATRAFSGQATPAEITLWIGMVVGLALLLAGGTWTALWFASVRRSKPEWGPRFLAGLVTVALLVFAGASAQAGYAAEQVEQQRVAAVQIRTLLALFLKDELDATAPALKPVARGRAGAVERRVRADMAAAVTLHKRYQADMEALAPEKIDARGLTLPGVNDFAARFGKARALTTAYRAAIRKQLVVVRTSFVETGFSPWIARDYLPGFEEAFRMKQRRYDRALGRQEEYLGVNQQRMQLLARSYGRWSQGRFGIMFNRLEDYREAESTSTRLSYITWQLDTGRAEDRQADADFAAKLAEAGIPY